jgi:hypothetical protein
VAAHDGSVYVGGFGTLTFGGVPMNNVARWSGTDWFPVGSGVDGDVYSIAFIGDDMYVGGQFTTAGGVPASNLARWDGTIWSQAAGGANGTVREIVFDGTNLYVGGDFTMVGTTPANRIARWDGAQWTSFGSGVDGPVHGIAIDGNGGEVYAVGKFNAAGTIPAWNIAVWNGSGWAEVGGGVGGVEYLKFPRCAAVDAAGRLYVGGGFDTAGGMSVQHIAMWDGAVWSDLDGGVNWGEIKAAVRDIMIDGTDVYITGDFAFANGVPLSGHIMRWDGQSWHGLGRGLSGSGGFGLCMNGGEIYVAGTFGMAGGKPSSCFARWSEIPTGIEITEPPSIETALLQNYPNPFNPTTTIEYRIEARAHVSLKVYNAAGQFVRTLVDEVQSPYAAHDVTWDGTDSAGQTVSSGVYFVKLVTKDFSQVKKMVLLR